MKKESLHTTSSIIKKNRTPQKTFLVVRNRRIDLRADNLKMKDFVESVRAVGQRYFGVFDKRNASNMAKRMTVPIGYEHERRRRNKH